MDHSSSGEFPRGKGPSQGGSTSKKIRFEDDDEDTGVTTSKKNEDLFKTKNKSSSVKKGKKKGSLTPGEERFLANTKVKRDERDFELHQLTYETLTEGVLTIGRVIKVLDNKILVSLPGRTVGSVSARDVSDVYSTYGEELLKKGTLQKGVEMQPLFQMFKPGMIIAVKVKSVTTTKFKTHRVDLTTNPKDLNSNWTVSLLNQGMIFTGAVKSQDEHGYQIDLGMNGVTAFLHKKQAAEYIRHINDGKVLGVGQVLPVKISRPVRVHRLMVTLSVEAVPSILRTTVTSNDVGLNYSMLLPGMLAEVIVMDVHKTGLKVHVFDLEGLIHRDHLEDDPEQFRVSQKINARILYILPNGTSPYLSLQPHMMPHVDKKEHLSVVELGSLQEVRIERQEKRGMIVRFTSGERGIVPIQKCVEEGMTTDEEIAKKYRVNSVHDCRVMEYALLDKLFIGSFQKHLLSKDLLLKPDQVVPGTLLNCKIKSWNLGGAVVELSPFLTGFIYKTHFGDKRVTNPQNKYPVNTIVKARVLTVDSSKKSIRLSAKKSIRDSASVVFTSFDQIRVGMTGHGIIRKIIPAKGLQIEAIGGVIGFMPISKVNLPEGITIEKKYQEDDIIMFEVAEVNVEKKSLIFGLAYKVNHDVLRGEQNYLKRKSKDKLNKSKSKKSRLSTENTTSLENNSSAENPVAETPSSGESLEQKKQKRIKENKILRKKRKQAFTKLTKTVKRDVPNKKQLKKIGLSNSKINDVFWKTSMTLAAAAFNETPVKLTKMKVFENDDDDSGIENNEEAAPSNKKQKSEETEDNAENKNVKNFRTYKKYEKLLANVDNVNNGSLWNEYMDSAIVAGDVDKARAIAYAGLNNNNFTFDDQRLILWYALLRLEVKYGDNQTLDKAIKEAVSRADKSDILRFLAYLYEDANKVEAAKKTYNQWVKESKCYEAYKRAAAFFYRTGDFREGRMNIWRAVKSFADEPSTVIVLLIGQTKLEHQFGEPAKAIEVMESLVKTYPTRPSTWNAYVNSLISQEMHDQARELFQRIFKQFHTLKQLKTFIPLYNDFKTNIGDSPENKKFISQVVTNLVTEETKGNGNK